ncbi:MFS transporter [Dactylosporangium fulvum]|uniref:MFS transporter n=1 Tax=Dactylosporangium fulvum TaxID=53359 RepID=A0ABY5VN18_9ACTN|nr:MFS transporter [Dactylosporangium fulvum]UWP78515.1 MFS transporter [Dactylosporangium fulvum]
MFLLRPYAIGLTAANLLVRLSAGAVTLALVLFVTGARGSFAAAGLVAGAFAVGTAVGGPLAGRLADRAGPAPVLLGTAAVHTAALLAVVGLPAAPLPVLVALTALAGSARPPVAAVMRGVWITMLRDDERQLRASYRFESALLEVGFIAGPAVAGLVVALGRPALGLALTAALAGGATAVFALLPPARTGRPAGRGERSLLGPLRSPAIRSLVASRTALGVTIGAVQVAAAAFAAAQGRAGFAGGAARRVRAGQPGGQRRTADRRGGALGVVVRGDGTPGAPRRPVVAGRAVRRRRRARRAAERDRLRAHRPGGPGGNGDRGADVDRDRDRSGHGAGQRGRRRRGGRLGGPVGLSGRTGRGGRRRAGERRGPAPARRNGHRRRHRHRHRRCHTAASCVHRSVVTACRTRPPVSAGVR